MKKHTRKPKPSKYARLAKHLSAVLKNKHTPAFLYEQIAMAMCDMSSYLDYDTPEMLEKSLIASNRKERRR